MSIAFHLNALKETWTGIGQDLISRGFIKDAIGGLTSLSDALAKVTGNSVAMKGAFSALVGMILAMKSASTRALGTYDAYTQIWDKGWAFSLKNLFASGQAGSTLKSRLSTFWNGGLMPNLHTFTQNGVTSVITQNDLNILNQYNDAVITGAANADQLKDSMLGLNGATANTSAAFRHYYNAQVNAGKSSQAIAQGMQVIGARAKLMTVGVQAANIAMNALLSIGISMAITGVIYAFDQIVNRVKKAKEAVESLSSEIDSINKTIESHKETVDKAKESYYELSKGVDKLSNKNVNLSDEDYKKFLEINKELGEQFPSLIKGLGDEGSYILDIGNNAEESAKKLDMLYESQRKVTNQDIIDKANKGWKDYKTTYESLVKDKRLSQANIDAYNYVLEQIDSSSPELFDMSDIIYYLSDDDTKVVTERVEDTLSKIFGDEKVLNDFKKKNDKYNVYSLNGLGGLLGLAGWDMSKSLTSYDKEILEEGIANIRGYVAQRLRDISNEHEMDQNSIKDFANNVLLSSVMAKLENSSTYNELGETSKRMAGMFVSNFDDETRQKFLESDSLDAFVDDYLLKFKAISDSAKGEELLKDVFSAETLGDWNAAYDEFVAYCESNGLQIPFELEYDGPKEVYEKIKEKFPDAPVEWVESLSPDDARVVLTDDFEKGLDSMFAEVEDAYALRVEKAKNQLEDDRKNLEDELWKLTNWADGDLIPFHDDVVNRLIQTKFGNVNMDKRFIIEWSDELKQTLAEELDSWNYNPDVGGIDTVYGGAQPFVLDGKEIEVSYTPVLVGKDGKSFGFLSQDTLRAYIQTVLDEADKAISNSGEEWSKEAVLKKALEIDAAGLTDFNVETYNNYGERIGTEVVKGMISGIDSYTGEGGASIFAGIVQFLTHFVGIFGAIQIDQDNVANSEKELAEATDALSNSFDKGAGAAEAYGKTLEKVKDANDNLADTTPKTISKSVSNIYNNLKPELDALGTVYSKIFDNGKMNLSAIGSEDLQGLLQNLDNTKEEVKQAFDLDIVEKFFDVITDKGIKDTEHYKTKVEEVQAAFDEMATSALDKMKVSDDVDENTFNAVVQMLSQLGVENADVVTFGAALSNLNFQMQGLGESGLALNDVVVQFDEAGNTVIGTTDEMTGGFSELSDAQMRDLRSFIEAKVGAEDYAQALAMLKLQKVLVNENWINEGTSIEQVLALANAAGVASDAVAKLADIQARIGGATAKLNEAMADTGSWGAFKTKFYTNEINILKQQAKDTAKQIADDIANAQTKYKPPGGNNGDGGGGGGGKSNKDLEKEEDLLAKINKQIDDLQDAYSKLEKIQKTYNETGKITIDQAQELSNMDFRQLAMLKIESGSLDLNKDAWDEVTKAKINDLKVALMLKALDLISTFKDEAVAAQWLANSYIDAAKAGMTLAEVMAQVAGMNLGEKGQEAANEVLRGLTTALEMMDNVDLNLHTDDKDSDKEGKDDKDKDEPEKDKGKYADPEHDPEGYAEEGLKHTYIDFIERALDKVSKTVTKWTDRVDKLFTFWNKNWAINQSISAIQTQISMQQTAAKKYLAQAKQAAYDAAQYVKGMDEDGEILIGGAYDLEELWVRKIKNGAMEIADFTGHEDDDIAQQKISSYIEWYDKAISVQEKITELYNQQKELIKQKFDNILEYFNTIGEYLSSVTSLIDSQISLKNAKGERTSLTDLLRKFSATMDERDNIEEKLWSYVTGVSRNDQRSSEDVQKDIDDTNTYIAGTDFYIGTDDDRAYLQGRKDQVALDDRLIKENRQAMKNQDSEEKKVTRSNIKDLQADKKQNKLTTKESNRLKADNKLIDVMDDIYGIGMESDQDRLIAEKAELEAQKQIPKVKNRLKQINRLLNSAEQNAVEHASQFMLECYAEIDDLLAKKEKKGKLTKAQENKLESLRKSIDTENEMIANAMADQATTSTAVYQDVVKKLEKERAKKNKGQKALDNIQMYSDEIAEMNKGILADDIVLFRKTYEQWWRLNNTKNKTGNLTLGQWNQYNNAEKILDNIRENYAKYAESLVSEMDDSLLAEDKLAALDQGYEKRKKEIDELYDQQMEQLDSDIMGTSQYKQAVAKIQSLEAQISKREAQGKNVTKQKQELEKYKKLQADLLAGATSDNIKEFMEAWNYVYNVDSGKTKINVNKYQNYKNKIDKWNKEKAAEIKAITEQHNDALEEAELDYEKNKQEVEKELADKDKELWDMAREAAEWSITNLQQMIDAFDRIINDYKAIIDVLQNVPLDSLKNFPGVAELLGIDDGKTIEELFSENIEGGLENATKKINASVEKGNAQIALRDALLEGGTDAAMEFIDKYKDLVVDENKAMFDDAAERLANMGASMDELNHFKEIIFGNLGDEERDKATDFINDMIDAYKGDDGAAFESAARSLITLGETSEAASNAVSALVEWLQAGNYDDTNTWIEDLDNGIAETKKETVETVKEVNEFYSLLRENVLFKGVNDAIKKLDDLQTKLNSVMGIIDDEWLMDVNGVTEFGAAKAALLVEEYDSLVNELSSYQKKIEQIDKAWESGAYNGDQDKYLSERNEAVNSYYSTFASIEDVAKKLYDISKKQQENEISQLKKVSDAYKKALQNKKSLYEYSRNLQKQQKEVDLLKAEIMALENVNTAEAKAQKAQLEANLKEQQESLDDMIQEHEFDLSTDALDEFISKLEETLDDSSNTIKETFEEFINGVRNAFGIAEGADLVGTIQTLFDTFLGLGSGKTESVGDIVTDQTVVVTDDNKEPVLQANETVDVGSDYVKVNQDDFLNSLITFGDRSIKPQFDSTNHLLVHMDEDIVKQQGNTTEILKTLQAIRSDTQPVDIDLHFDQDLNMNGASNGSMQQLYKECCDYTMTVIMTELKKLGFYQRYR